MLLKTKLIPVEAASSEGNRVCSFYPLGGSSIEQ